MKKIEELAVSRAPWKVSPNNDILVTTKEGYRVAIGCCERYDGGTGNARLIAAAPELYKCLHEAVIEMCHGHACCGEEYECNGVDYDCLVKRWRAALAKASGEEMK